MATKGDLVEAQRYSRRRLRTAFTSGIPQGTELEPRNYLRAIVGGFAAAALMIVGSLLFGYLKPGLPEGWDNNKLLVGGSGARYVSVNGQLYPVANLASARLMIPAGKFQVKSVDEKKLSSAPRGPLAGILGAPDALPAAKSLTNTDWVSCLNDEDTTLASTLGDVSGVEKASNDEAILIQVDDVQYLVMNGHRYELPGNAGERTQVLRALGLDSAAVTEVTARWANLFTPGSAITGWGPDTIGTPLNINPSFSVGEILTLKTGSGNRYYFVDPSEQLIEVSEFALRLYAIAAKDRPEPREVSQQDIASLTTATTSAVPEDWPDAAPVALDAPGDLCAVLTTGKDGAATPALANTVAGDQTPEVDPFTMTNGDTVRIAPDGGALVAVRGEDPKSDERSVYLVDSLGNAYPIVADAADAIQRLGYKNSDVSFVPRGWTGLFVAGPALSIDGALTIVGTDDKIGAGAATTSPSAAGTDGEADTEPADTEPTDAVTVEPTDGADAQPAEGADAQPADGAAPDPAQGG